jgi:hypothetical protein
MLPWGKIYGKNQKPNMRSTALRILALMSAVVLTGNIYAELPPWAYKERQDKAPEALVIKVRSVNKRETTGKDRTVIEFTVKAEVEKVERSATKLSPGAVIEIFYTQTPHSQPITGPSEIPALKEGQVCPAYLSREGLIYSPAAGGYSFQTVR